VDSFDDLIARCLCREPAAEKRLYDRLAPVLLGLCRRYFANPEDAEDAMIQSLLTVFEKLPQFRYEGSFEGWARRIAVHTSLMALRKKKVDFSSAEDVASLDVPADFSLDSQDRTQAILACVQALPEGYRTVFNLFAVEGYSHAEIADALGISEATSKSQYSRARARLQAVLTAKGLNRAD
jgi:RNA polymerase sigma-70 factor (ECF subfamily)